MRSRFALALSLAVMTFACAPALGDAGDPSSDFSGDATGGAGTQAPAALDSLLAAPALDLALLERAVLERNPSLGAMRAAWEGAQASADQVGALEDPMVDFSTAPRSWGSSAMGSAYMVEIAQRFPIFGQRGLRGRAARGDARAIGEDYRGGRLNLVRETRRAYLDYYLVARNQAVNVDLKDLLTQFRRTALGKYSAGTVGLDDALQAEVELAMLDHVEVALVRERRVLAAQINALLRRASTSPFPEPPAVLPIAPGPPEADSVRSAAFASRPELRGWDAKQDAREADLSLAQRSRLPEFTFTARYDRFMNESDWRPQVGVGVNLPIFFGRLGAAEREARAGLEEANYRRQAAHNQVAYEVESALSQVQETHHEVEVVEERVVPSTERALTAIRASYENNRADFLTLLNAERDLARARLDVYEAKVRYLQALADLDRAVGVAPTESSTEVKR